MAKNLELTRSYFGPIDDAHDLRLLFGDKYLIVSVGRSEQLVVIDTGKQEIIQRLFRRCPPAYPACDQPIDGGATDGGTWFEPNVNVIVGDKLQEPHNLRLNPADGGQLAVGAIGTDQNDVVIVNLVDDPRGPIRHDDPNITSNKPSELTWTRDGKGIYAGTDFATPSAFQANQTRRWCLEVATKKAYPPSGPRRGAAGAGHQRRRHHLPLRHLRGPADRTHAQPAADDRLPAARDLSHPGLPGSLRHQ